MPRMRITLALLALGACSSSPAIRSTKPPAAAQTVDESAQIREIDLRKHVALLASDEFAGRETLTHGYERAAQYIAAEFALYGLAPLPGHNGFVVPYKLWQKRHDDSTVLTLEAGGEQIVVTLGKDAAPFSFSDDGAASAELVFAGYGITAKDQDYDDYKGLDVAGKWVLVLRHAPGYHVETSPFFAKQKASAGKPDPRRHAAFRSKALNAQEHGALGMLLVSGPATATSPDDLRMPTRLQLPAMKKVSPEAGAAGKKQIKGNPDKADKKLLAFHVSPAIVNTLLATTGMTLEKLQAQTDAGRQASEVSLTAKVTAVVATHNEPVEVLGKNVIGYVQGSDPALKDEIVVIGGHFDHLGATAAQANEGPDTIFNGADDNASGTSGVLELAQAFANSKSTPKRSLLFVAFSGEEKGLLGSRALVQQEIVDTKKIVFMLNLDMIGRNSDKTIEFVGAKNATLVQEIIEKANQSIGLSLEFGDYAANSDHHPFYMAEVPVAFFFTGLHDDYHGLGDHIDKLDFVRMKKIVKLGFQLVQKVANDNLSPVFIHQLGWLGVWIQKQGSGQVASAIISKVEPDSRASQAGLIPNDEIVEVNGRKVVEGIVPRESKRKASSVGALLSAIAPGTTIEIAVLRQGVSVRVKVERAKVGYLGIFPGFLSKEDRQKHNISKSQGVLLVRAIPKAPAFKSGLRDGDIITTLGGYDVNRKTLTRRLSRIGAGEPIAVQLIRDGKRMEIQLTLGARD